MKRSVKQLLLSWLLIPLLSLSVLSTAAAYFLGISLARNIYDKQLLNSADSVAARIKARGDDLSVDLPPAARSILRHNDQDQFFFQIVSPDGRLITGDKSFPIRAELNIRKEPVFSSIDNDGQQLRVVSVVVETPACSFDHVILQAAETRNTRTELVNQITLSIVLAQMILIVSGALAIWIGVGRGLLPLTKIERAVEDRSPRDLSPLELDEPIEIASLIKALNRLFKQVDDDIELQKRFTSNAAHQLRTPLAVLGTYCDLALRLVHDREARDVLTELDSGIVRMSRLVSRLLVLARSEPAGALSAGRAEMIDMNHCAALVTAAHVPESIRLKRIDLEFQSAAEPALVYGDQEALEELISILIENSILYSASSTSVLVRLMVRAQKVTLTVQDDGPGIPPQERDLVFERFYRIPGTAEPGTGLGLAIVKEIAAAHQATIEITEGRNQKGTAINVIFPQPTIQDFLPTVREKEIIRRKRTLLSAISDNGKK